MISELAEKKALIAGASGGIGKAIAEAFAREGIRLALMGRNRDKLNVIGQACKDLGTEAFPIACDLSQTATIEAAVDEAVSKLGGLNFLINCTGIYKGGKAHEVELRDWDSMLDINLKAHYYLVRHAVPEINKQSGGAVINIGSISGSYSGAGMYLAISRAHDGYGEALFEDVREFGTKVCTIRPGFVNTSLAASDRVDPARMIQPDDIARTILFVLTMPNSACPTEIVIRPQRSPYRNT